MNTALWICQGLAAAMMIVTGGVKVAQPREKLAERLHWAKTWSDANVKLLGLAEVIGAIGLVVPSYTGILPVLTPISAVCLAILMLGAVATHIRLKEGFFPPVVPLALCVFIALGRFGLI